MTKKLQSLKKAEEDNFLYFHSFYYNMKFTYMLAPLEDATDNALRELCYNHGVDLAFTEMTRLSGLARNNKSTLRKIDILNNVPTQIQLAANNENKLKEFLKDFQPRNGFAGFNFNLGCPSQHFIKAGLGCALIKRVSKVQKMVEIVKSFNHPCSIKMRLGMNHYEKKKKTYLNLIKNVDADFFVVHGRHGMEHYESTVDYRAFEECIATGKNIVANGDIDSKERVKTMKDMGMKGVMIGRAAVRNPGIFNEIKTGKPTNFEELKKEYTLLSNKYLESNNNNTKYRDNILKRLGVMKTSENKHKVMG